MEAVTWESDLRTIILIMIMDMEIITDMILISEAAITGGIIHYTIIAGTHPLSSISTSETDGTTIIMAGTVVTIMATIITDQISMHIIIIITIIVTIIIIQTDLPPPHIQTGGIPAIILNLPHVLITHQEGRYHPPIIPGGRHHPPVLRGMKLIVGLI